MFNLNSAKKVIESIGKNTSPLYAVVSVACANAVFKPLSTLIDKKEKKETKTYTALREIITEIVAIPTYIMCYKIAEKGASVFKKPNKARRAKSNLGFLGVCTAAVFVIPALCSVVIKPLTDRIYHKNPPQLQPEKPILTKNNQKNSNTFYPSYNNSTSFRTFKNWGLRV